MSTMYRTLCFVTHLLLVHLFMPRSGSFEVVKEALFLAESWDSG